jgi:hypothetical protein
MTFSHVPAVMLPNAPSKVSAKEKAKMVVWEAANILGYIPVVGLIVGIARAIFAAVGLKSGNEGELRKPFMIRALIEALSLGIFLLPMDIFNTVLFVQEESKKK